MMTWMTPISNKAGSSICVGLVLAFVILLFCQESMSAVRSVTLGDMANKSALVFEGRVVGKESREVNTSHLLQTYVTFEVIDVIKGTVNTRTVTFAFMGGTLGDKVMQVGDMQIPRLGERGIYFVENPGRVQVHPFYGWSQGHFLIDKDLSGVDRVMSNRNQPIVKMKTSQLQAAPTDLSNGVARGVITRKGAKMTDAIPLGMFKSTVRKMLIQ